MHVRYLASLIAGLAGGFLVVASQAFASGTTAWLAFATGIGLLVIAAFPVLFGDRTVIGLALDGLSGVLAIWTVVASLVFSGEVVKWLSFAEGAGFVVLAVGSLTLNEIVLAQRAHGAPPVQLGAAANSAETTRPTAVAA